MKHKTTDKTTDKIIHLLFYASLVFYAVFLLWNILFKYTAPWQLFSSSRYYSRTLNLVPYYDWLAGGYFNSLDLYGNIILFLPMGIYLNYYSSNTKLLRNIFILAVCSFSLEALQYILAIGASDITDIINNTLGGLIGILLCRLLFKIVKTKEKAKLFIGIASGCAMILVAGLVAALFLFN